MQRMLIVHMTTEEMKTKTIKIKTIAFHTLTWLNHLSNQLMVVSSQSRWKRRGESTVVELQ